MRRKIIAWITLLSMLFAVPASGSTVNNKKNELNSAKKSIENSKEALEGTKTQKQAVTDEINDLDSNMIKVEDELLSIEGNLKKKKSEIKIAEQKLEKAIEKRDVQYEATKKRMVHMYKNRKVGYLELVFSSGSFWEMLNRMQYIKVISAHDKDLLTAYEAQKKVVEDQKVELENEKVAIEKLYKKQMARKDELEKMRSAKNDMLGNLKKEEQKLYAKIEEMEQVSKDLEAQIKKLTQTSPVVKYSGGQFLWPVPGYYGISSEYNPRSNPVSGRFEFHTGIDIPASYGRDVVAAADGVVINSGWIRGYGNTIMINHGSGLVTLYGHNSSLVVSEGEHVQKGQAVAHIGSTGNSTGNHCHFEVRINGSHTNPWQYLN